jgi:hypothetical protein
MEVEVFTALGPTLADPLPKFVDVRDCCTHSYDSDLGADNFHTDDNDFESWTTVIIYEMDLIDLGISEIRTRLETRKS